MADKVELRPDGITAFRWDEDLRATVEFVPEDPIVHLRDTCEIAEGTTLGDVLRWVHSEPELEHFLARYSWCRSIEAFAFEAGLSPGKPDDGSIEHLEVYWHATWHEDKDGCLSLSTGFHGIGKYVEDDLNTGVKAGDPTAWAVSYCPVNDIAHLPLKLNPAVSLTKWGEKGRTSTALESKRPFSLLEVLDAILWDISFAGGPKDKIEFLASLDDRCESDERISLDEVLRRCDLEDA